MLPFKKIYCPPQAAQTEEFARRGVRVTDLYVAKIAPAPGVVDSVLEAADVVLCSGGNTLFAVDRWKQFGVDKALRRCMERGVVLCGGSAGAICWFDSGHSDSMDPESYRAHMLAAAAAVEGCGSEGKAKEDAKEEAKKEEDKEEEKRKPWSYIRIDGLGFLPGLCCPHHDRVQSNGVLRASDFDGMLGRHPQETGVALDHFAALVISEGHYRVIALEGKTGSVGGEPGLIVKRASQGAAGRESGRDGDGGTEVLLEVKATVPGGGDGEKGSKDGNSRRPLAELFRPALGPVTLDPKTEVARMENPSFDLAP
mmetsp:Transcript_48586/g.97755  ORF Transcript_48586/g.97755 Transcript_48586/m.97755 type:complete len:312 (-) Transcript_48586:238-1173(-)